MTDLYGAFEQIIAGFMPLFTAPTARSFQTVVLGWMLCQGRRTLSGVIRAAGWQAQKSHDAYQNFFSKSRWSMNALWERLFLLLVEMFSLGEKPIFLAGDDTITKHWGRKIWGAGLYRDATRSSKKYTAYAWGLNWVVLAAIIEIPLFPGRFIALPVMVRLNPKDNSAKKKGKGSKNKKTTVTIMNEMVCTIAGWRPGASFIFCGDGAYASVAGVAPPNVEVVSRMRCDAALFATPPNRSKGQRGRPRRKGKRLPSPQQMAGRKSLCWKTRTLFLYGREVRRDLFTFTAIWYSVCPDRPIRIVIVRDPDGKHDDEYFFSTDFTLSAEQIVLYYSGRWSIEVVFRESKQYFGMGEAQARTKKAVLRITPFCLWLNSLLKACFLGEHRNGAVELLLTDQWYQHKETISFQDMLGALCGCSSGGKTFSATQLGVIRCIEFSTSPSNACPKCHESARVQYIVRDSNYG